MVCRQQETQYTAHVLHTGYVLFSLVRYFLLSFSRSQISLSLCLYLSLSVCLPACLPACLCLSLTFVVGKGRTEPDETNELLRGLDLPHRARDDRFQHRPAVIVEKVDLINDDQFHQLRVRAIAGLAGDDVPLLRCRHDHLRRIDLDRGERSV